MRIRPAEWLRRFSASYLLALAFLGLSFITYYLWHLSSLTRRRISPTEALARTNSASLHNLLKDPVGLPQKFLQFVLQKLGYHGALSLRLASVIIAFGILLAMFKLLRSWFGATAGLAVALIFATTPLVVLLARSGTSDILLLAPAAVIAAYVHLSRRQRDPDRPWLILVVVTALSLYTPGMAWLVLGGLLFMRQRIAQMASSVSTAYIGTSLVLALLLLAPLVAGLIGTPALYHSWLLLPWDWGTPLGILSNLGWATLAYFWHTHWPNDLILGDLPILSGVQICLVVFGGYVMWARARREMACILSVIIFSIVAAGLNRNVLLLAMGLPGMAILVGGGLRYLYVEWRNIFPLNPLPLGLAWALIITVVVLQMAYGLRYSLIAWPHSPATKLVYVLK